MHMGFLNALMSTLVLSPNLQWRSLAALRFHVILLAAQLHTAPVLFLWAEPCPEVVPYFIVLLRRQVDKWFTTKAEQS